MVYIFLYYLRNQQIIEKLPEELSYNTTYNGKIKFTAFCETDKDVKDANE